MSAPAGGLDLSHRINDALHAQHIPLDEAGELQLPHDEARRRRVLDAVLLASTAMHPVSGDFWFELPAGGELVVAYAERFAGRRGALAVLDHSLTSTEWQQLERLLRLPADLTSVESHAGVVEVVLERLPVPSDDVPIEEVLDFVAQPEVQEQAESLRLWMRRAALEADPREEIALELDEMLHEFRRSMEVERLKNQTSTFRAIVSVPLAVLEELAHFKPKAALDAAISIRARRAERLEAEFTAPGHEVAYIDVVQRAF